MSSEHSPSVPKPLSQRVADVILGRDPVQRRAVKRLIFATNGYLVLWCLLGLAVLADIAQPRGLWVVAYGVFGQCAFYALLRSGATIRLPEPLLCFPQALYGVVGVVLSYGLQSFGQGPALQLLIVILVYDLHRLTARQIAIIALTATLLLAGTVFGMAYLWPQSVNLRQEVFNMIMAAVAMPALVAIGRIVRSVYLRRLAQEAALTTTLAGLKTLSQTDALTGAFNRRHMGSLLDAELKRHKRTGRPFCVAMLDIDFFKRINDGHGHAVGDIVLQQLTTMARDNLPETDLVARWGGEEFLILLPEASAADAKIVIDLLRQRVHEYDWVQHSPELVVSFSCGVAEHQPRFSLEQTIERADAALYRAKNNGRNRVEVDGAFASSIPMRKPISAKAVRRARPVLPNVAAILESATATNRAKPVITRPLTALNRLGDWLLGIDPKMRLSAELCLLSSALYLCWILGLLYSDHAGYMAPSVTGFAISYYLVGMLAFYPLVRSGLTARVQDLGLVQAQILWGASALMIVYPFNPTLRAAMMETLCLQQLFGLFALRPRKLIANGVAIVGMQLLMLASAAYLHPPQFNVGEETYKVLYSCFIISLITWISVLRSRDKAQMLASKKKLAAAVEQLNELVTHDSLTGLFNRKHMQELLERESARQAQTGKTFCVALIDLDHFKRVNDTHGHQVGDDVLCGFAKTAHARMRETDTIARWGGEEFLILMPDTPTEVAAKVPMDRLHQHIETMQPSASVPTLRVTFSAGLAAHAEGQSTEETLARADRALYLAKDSGRNRTMLASQAGATEDATGAAPGFNP